MKDREFLIWIHARLSKVHGESECMDYMHRLRSMIKRTPKDQYTVNCGSGNSLEELLKELD
jgi:hypothetical protein